MVTDLLVSTDEARTWRFRATLPGVEDHNLCEPAVLVRDDRVQVYCRDEHRDPETGQSASTTVNLSSGLSEEEIVKTMEDVGAVEIVDGGAGDIEAVAEE